MVSPGARLKGIRLERGISLEEVQKKTKIHLNILKAIEGDSLTNLSPVYLKGFLKIYCRFLGLNPQEYITDYKEPASPEPAVVTGPVSDKPIKSDPFFKSPAIRLPSFKDISKKVRNAFVFILILIILGAGLFKLGKFISSRPKLRPKTTSKFAAVVKPKREAAKPTMPVAKGKAAAPVTPIKKEASSGIRLGIRTKENCWVSLKADGHLVFQRVLEKGRFESWQAKDKIELSLGNAAAVELEVNGQLFSNLGRKGQTRNNIVITKEGLSIAR